ncbi:MAG: hypothetical protein AAFR46_04445 [Pseudomonadota bacterium]
MTKHTQSKPLMIIAEDIESEALAAPGPVPAHAIGKPKLIILDEPAADEFVIIKIGHKTGGMYEPLDDSAKSTGPEPDDMPFLMPIEDVFSF